MFSDQEGKNELSEEERERYFKQDLDNLKDDEQEIYYKLLAKERVKRAKEVKGRPPIIQLEEREEFLRRSKILADGKRRYGLDPIKQAENWDQATYKGRPPIGGATDD